MMQRTYSIQWLVFAFIIGIITNYAAANIIQSQTAQSKLKIVRQDGYRYIAPLLRCDAPSGNNSKQAQSLFKNINGYINTVKQTSSINNVSLYFRDIKSADWFTINEADKYAPASLLKVPIMMAVYKKASSNPAILNTQVTYDGGSDNRSLFYAPTDEMKEGQTYSYDNLVERMITESDNTAKNLLLTTANNSDLKQLFQEIKINPDDDFSETMSVTAYANFFRTLYSSTYLNNSMSEKALQLLAKTTFHRGIASGVPAGIPVAHKFGERSSESNTSKQLHDCGIVYHPDRPYILCIMTKGNEFLKLEEVIQTVSKMTFDAVSAWHES